MNPREKCETCYTRVFCPIAETLLSACSGPYSSLEEHITLVLRQYHSGELTFGTERLKEEALTN